MISKMLLALVSKHLKVRMVMFVYREDGSFSTEFAMLQRHELSHQTLAVERLFWDVT